MLGLFDGTKSIGRILCHEMNLRNLSVEDKKCLEILPPDALDQIVKMGHSRIILSGHRFVDSDWSKDRTDVPVFEVLAGLAIKLLQESTSTALIVCKQPNKKVNKDVIESWTRHGASLVPLSKPDDQSVLLVTTQRMSRQSRLPEVKEVVEIIWDAYIFKNLKIAA